MSEYTARDAEHWDNPEVGRVLAIRASMDGWSATAEEKFWEEAVAWCNSQQLFPGGNAEAAVVYMFDARRLPRLSRQLRNFLLSRLDEHRFRLELVDLRWLRTPRLQLAATEAIASAQYYLFERALATSEALAAVASAAGPSSASTGFRVRRELGDDLLEAGSRCDRGAHGRATRGAFEKFREGIRSGEFHELTSDTCMPPYFAPLLHVRHSPG